MSSVGIGSFDIMFTIVPFIVLIGFIFVFGSIIYSGINIAKNKRKPIIPVKAKIVSKRTQVRGGHVSHNNMHAHRHARTYYYATFELENGERMELAIPLHEAGYIVEGDSGILSFQGDLFVKFDRV